MSPRTGPVVVLGGAGYVGRHVCAAFAALGREVLVVGRRPATGLDHPQLTLDLSAAPVGELVRLLDTHHPTVVVNAVGGVWEVDDAQMTASNTTATHRLLEALSGAATRPRLVQLGSVLEYGSVPAGERVGERTPTRPESTYGRTKLAATTAVLGACAEGRVRGLVLRLANAAGPGAPTVSLLGRVADRLVRVRAGVADPVVELGPLRACRDYIDVRDIADAVVAAAAVPASGRTVAIGRGEAVPVRDLVDLLVEVSGVAVRIVESDRASSRRTGADWLAVDPAGAREVLGWGPRRSLREAVAALWAEAVGYGVRDALPTGR
ncbi:NAD-dependent epimerase/dehydratase family protein [Micromonospora auratinigra]|uniref:Nucleoside-diphosphate-sugar epimerase n=1 Tax=Micromonospora auratinigra TaxID=261654 RepID=A0A1A8ZG27_9ACTN|nr:NAD-dependent epimerase/dehydratase family protein [Micromonospora auratinigra]SBT42822.1 Nucleoside-diphosphate-sugar epimerase [Micromonospora auratinigra]